MSVQYNICAYFKKGGGHSSKALVKGPFYFCAALI